MMASGLLLLLAGCGSSGPAADAPEEVEILDAAALDPNPQAVPEPEWRLLEGEARYLRPRTWNLHHQAARLQFDFENEAVIGTTELTLSSLQAENNRLILDSKTTEFHSIRRAGSEEELSFRRDSAEVHITLNEPVLRGDTLRVVLEFTSFPPTRGLYFVDPMEEDASKPRQIWTLGQPEDNSFWLPTIDHPAERATQEFWLTVPEEMQTLSNGFLISSENQPRNNTRIDYWRLDKPHTPYLFALAVGEFDITERWVDDIYYAYYTEPEYAEHKELIYARTEDIMEYFEAQFDYEYPWGAYAQVPVHEFIARGMENTTATILYNLVQFDERGALDRSNLALIVHELVHQWFGNLVTTKDWANLPFNEGLANYFEILYKRDRLGYEEGMWHSLGHKNDYFAEAARYRRPIIFNEYSEPEDMYDRHTYAKAGQVLGMLEAYVGTETWWNGLSNFLHTYEYQAVDMRDLQHIFEQETGENLNWFFDQWFYEPGHPDLRVEFGQTAGGGEVIVTLEQLQRDGHQPVFRLESEVELVMADGSRQTHDISLRGRQQAFSFPLEEGQEVRDVIFDPAGIQLAEIHESLTAGQLRTRLAHEEPAVRLAALQYIEKQEMAGEVAQTLLERARQEDFKPLQAEVAGALIRLDAPDFAQERAALAFDLLADETLHFGSRRNAIDMLAQTRGLLETNAIPAQPGFETRFQQALGDAIEAESYFVSAAAIMEYARQGYRDAVAKIEPYKDAYSWNDVVRTAVARAMTETENQAAFDVLLHLATQPGDKEFKAHALQFLGDYIGSERQERAAIEAYISTLDDPYLSNRLHAINALGKRQSSEITRALQARFETAEHPTERAALRSVLEE
ncbi:MAG: M1 family aminopeptidase [Cyclonatronaceae bacterium]